MTVSVLLIDDHPTFLRILARFLADHGEGALQVVGTVLGGRDALAQAEAFQPEIVLVDLQMPLQSGVALLPHLRARLPDSILVALSLLDPDQYQAATRAAGADAFVSKMHLEDELLPTLHRLAARPPGRHRGPARSGGGVDGTESRPPQGATAPADASAAPLVGGPVLTAPATSDDRCMARSRR